MRTLIIDDQIREKARALMIFANQHHYVPYAEAGNYEVDEAICPPGDNPNYCVEVPDGYLCVFTITEIKGEGLYRDLSVSVPVEGKYPSKYAMLSLASELFEFSGWDPKRKLENDELPEGWMAAMDVGGRAIRFVQRIGEA